MNIPALLIESKVDQTDEELWAGLYGIQYTTKFSVDWEQRIDFLRTIVAKTGARKILDVGCNAGWNMRALRTIDSTLDLVGVEINGHTAISAGSVGFKVVVTPAREVGKLFPGQCDLVITSGLLIHVPPHQIKETMEAIVQASNAWVLAVEYPADVETVLRQRGDHPPRIWARPYGALYEELGLKLIENGEPGPGYLDCHYWLMRKGDAK